MPVPIIIWAGVAIFGVATGGWAAKQVGNAASDAGEASQKAASLAQWAVTGGTIYVAYRALKAGGALK